MDVYYCQMDGGNVGDDLNAVLWSTLVPGLAGIRAWDWLVGIGSILDRRIDSIPGSKIVMGTGYRPSANRWRPGANVSIAAVRGELTAAEFGLDGVAQCDPGFLVPRLFPEPLRPGTRVGFIPHVYSQRLSRIAHDAADRGLHVISPQLGIAEFISQLRQCSRVYCESMHAAIFADAFRIPWARVKVCSHYIEGPHVSDFKWRDSFSITGVDTTPVNRFALVPILRYGFRRRLNRPLAPVRRISEWRLAAELAAKANDSTLFRLSDESRLLGRTEALMRKINEIARHAADG